MAIGEIPAITWGSAFVNTLSIAFPIDNANTGSEPRAGSERSVGPSGTEDAWIVGTEEILSGTIIAIPIADATPDDNGNNATGWDGATGVKAALEWFLDAGLGRFIPDKDTPGTFFEFYLVEPTKSESPREPNDPNRRRLPFKIRSSDGTAFTGF